MLDELPRRNYSPYAVRAYIDCTANLMHRAMVC